MSIPVEAASLSSLADLLANPPQYPRNPTHQVHEPLVLYIVRVPGSRDVFLTPLKPPTKASISLEAIQSSLYYFHVPIPEDDEYRESLARQSLSDEQSRPNVNVSRKPLPNTPFSNYPPHDRPQPPPKAYPHYQPGLDGPNETQAERYAARGSHLRLNTSTDSQARRKPLGPRILLHQDPPDWTTKSFDAPPPDYALSEDEMPDNSAGTGGDFGHPHRQGQPPASSSQTGASPSEAPIITMIRRDPASGGQWNIGSITQLRSTFKGSSLQPVSIELATPGYNRFARNDEFPQPPSAGSDAASIKLALDSAMSSATPHSPGFAEHKFERVVEYRNMIVPDARPRKHERINSIDILHRPGAPSSKDASLAKSVLSFHSPWHGMCSFSNAIDGKSLRCRHTVTGNSSALEAVTQTVSELRFNLGWTIRSKESLKSSIPEPDKLPIPKLLESKKENFRRSLQNFKHKSWDERKKSPDRSLDDLNPYSPAHVLAHTENRNVLDLGSSPHTTPDALREEEYEEEGRLSLKLGREKAGGGYRGNSAKLGKLIIEDEGLKMADLVVAANIGIWFQYWWREN